MEKRPNDLSSRRVRAVPCLIAGAVVRSPHALGLCCLTVAWGRVGRNEPWCRLSLVTAGTATGNENSGISGLKPKPSRHIRLVPVWAWHPWRQLLHRWRYQ